MTPGVKHRNATGGPSLPISKAELHRGDVMVWREQDEWFVVTAESPNWPTVVCIASEQAGRVGTIYGVSTGLNIVPEDKVPNKVWVHLALWRLGQ